MKQFVIPAIVCMFSLMAGCKKNSTPPPKYLTVHKGTVTLKGELNSKDTIYIASNDNWVVTLESGVDWISVEPSSGTGDGMIIITTILKNTAASRKTTNVEVKAVNSTDSRLITVVQVQLNQVLLNAVLVESLMIPSVILHLLPTADLSRWDFLPAPRVMAPGQKVDKICGW